MVTTHVHLVRTETGKFKEYAYVSFQGKDLDKEINPVRCKVLPLDERKLDGEGKLLNKPQEVQEFFFFHESKETVDTALSFYPKHKLI